MGVGSREKVFRLREDSISEGTRRIPGAYPVLGNELVLRRAVHSVTFLDSLAKKGVNAWDVSEVKDGTVWAWTTPAEGDLVDLYIGANGKIQAPVNSAFLFAGYTNAEQMDLEHLVTSGVTDMFGMFFDCNSLTELDVSSFDTSNVTDMSGMFFDCNSLTELDVSSFDTSNVADMCRMFSGCNSLAELDVSSFDTSNVADMYRMFFDCNSLTELDLSNFETANAGMSEMFSDCSSLTELDISHFDISNIAKEPAFHKHYGRYAYYIYHRSYPYCCDRDRSHGVHDMFYGCVSLTLETITLPTRPQDAKGLLEALHTDFPYIPNSLVQERKPLFQLITDPISENKEGKDYTVLGNPSILRRLVCSVTFLKSLKRKGTNAWDVSENHDGTVWAWTNSVADGLVDLYIGADGWIQAPTNSEGLFSYYTNAKQMKLKYLATESVTNMKKMFYQCSSLAALDVSHFNTASVTDMSEMFGWCCNLKEMNVSCFDTSNVTNMSGVFRQCTSLSSLDLSRFHTEKVTDMSWMFCGCTSLTTLDLSSFHISDGTLLDDIFPIKKRLKVKFPNSKRDAKRLRAQIPK